MPGRRANPPSLLYCGGSASSAFRLLHRFGADTPRASLLFGDRHWGPPMMDQEDGGINLPHVLAVFTAGKGRDVLASPIVDSSERFQRSRCVQASVSFFGIGGLGASLSPLIARRTTGVEWSPAPASLWSILDQNYLDLFPELVSERLRGIVSVLLGIDHVGLRCVRLGTPPSRDGRPQNVWLLLHGGWRHEYDVLMLSGGVSQLSSTLAFLHTDFHTAPNHSLSIERRQGKYLHDSIMNVDSQPKCSRRRAERRSRQGTRRL